MLIPRMRAAILTFIGFAILPAIAAADSSGSAAGGEQPNYVPSTSPADFLGSLAWVMVALAIVIVLIVFALRWLSRRNQLWGGNRSMRSLGGVALGQNKSVQVLEIGGRVYIVGVGEDITLLDRCVDPAEAEHLIALLDAQTSNAWTPLSMTDFVKKWLDRRSAQDEPGREQWNDPNTFQQMLNSKLSKQTERKQQLEEMLQDHKSYERLMDDEKK
ncbi:flagellar protein [Paenibacillus nanensis]|uniref:Flagellar protein n=2 Tax=Paenibacillus nanensis TaxID=393251 RepID=A0A3A1UU71_9BACL|nr:flagellar protein [Paenibacillus nanensis]